MEQNSQLTPIQLAQKAAREFLTSNSFVSVEGNRTIVDVFQIAFPNWEKKGRSFPGFAMKAQMDINPLVVFVRFVARCIDPENKILSTYESNLSDKKINQLDNNFLSQLVTYGLSEEEIIGFITGVTSTFHTAKAQVHEISSFEFYEYLKSLEERFLPQDE